ncbi:MAG: 16S rRNA (guanine(966)-N(2))-methyltransferase RsmD [Wenzhouxiangella sp.]|nr:16S rRNA (guanine(966)-N(2))-methyltransferase RsmD [Wenzhouxiangella sp.]
MTQKSPPRHVRIIAGAWRGRRVPVADVPGLRPTGDRVRETLFNWLAPSIIGAKVLDVFAGTGALGLEALSRQAQSVVFVDRSNDAMAHLKETTHTWPGIEKASFVCHDAMAWLAGPSEPFDLVFVDPPFDGQRQDAVLEALLAGHWIAPGGLIYVERPKSEARSADQWPLGLTVVKDKCIGQVHLALVRYHTG